MDLDALWGGMLVVVEQDIPGHRVRLVINVVEDGATTGHELRLEGVADFHFFSSIRPPWSYVDVTEARLTRADDGAMVVSLVLWSEDAGLTVECDSVTLDGVELGTA